LDVCSFATVKVSANCDCDRLSGPAVAYVPFDFVVGEILLPAGVYEIEPSGVSGMLMLRQAGTDSQPLLVQAINLDQRRRVIPEKLLFYCQQNLYFLAQAFTAPN
jgi:hypothetical protein